MPCPVNKKGYRTRAQAEKRAFNISREEGKLLYAYKCYCGLWHLTKKRPAKRSYKDQAGRRLRHRT